MTYCLYKVPAFFVRKSTFLTAKSDQDPELDPHGSWFGSLDPDPETH
jgi:hypothetical protein